MGSRWFSDLTIFAASTVGLVVGALLWFVGFHASAGWAWIAASLPAAIPLLWRVVAAIWRREAGVDLLALVAIAGALALRQDLTAAVIAVMLASGQLLESFAERRAGREMTALLARVPRSVHVYRDCALADIPVADVHTGDRLLVRHGEVIAVDGTLAAERGVLDESALTGESQPVTHLRGAALRSGTINAADAFEMVAAASAAESTYAGIVKLVESAQHSKAPAVRLADRYAAWFVPCRSLSRELRGS